MKKNILTLLALTALVSSSQAAFVAFTTGGARGHAFVLSDSSTRVLTTANNASSTVKVGYLTGATSDTFVTFGTTSVDNPAIQPAAAIGGFVTTPTADNAAANGALSSIAGRQLAIWVYGQNGQQGLFTSTSWTVPGTLTPASDQSFSILLGVSSAAGVAPVVSTIAIPGFSPASFVNPTPITVTTASTSTNANGSMYVLGAVPEPSVTALLGLLGLVGLRRKR